MAFEVPQREEGEQPLEQIARTEVEFEYGLPLELHDFLAG